MLPLTADGCLYHLGLKKGELAPRILTVGDYGRAERIAEDSLTNMQFKHTSDRGFSTWTGYFQGELVSIVAIGMGLSMMDFLVREARTIVDGPMAIIRFGTCGTLNESDEIGTLCVSTTSCLIARDPDYFITKRKVLLSNKTGKCSESLNTVDNTSNGYFVSKFEDADPILTDLLIEQLSKEKESKVISGPNGSADSFYSSQGRIVSATGSDVYFEDNNENLIDCLSKQIRTLEMETFQLFHLANCAGTEKISAAGVVMIVANRPKNLFAFCDSRKAHLERVGGRACLEALSQLSLSKK